jgi:glycosyltransferase involved in cell wall biosynthesis
MNILFLSRAFGQKLGGMERLSYETAQLLQQPPQLALTILHHRGSRGTSPLFNLTALPAALRAARQADRLHLGDPLLSFLGWLLKKIYKKPVSVSVHGLDLLWPNPLYQLYLKLFFNHFDAYFPISNHVKKLLQARGITSHLQILTPGFHDNFFDPTLKRTDLDQLLKTSTKNKIVVLTCGRLVQRKGHAWFISNVLPHLPKNILYVVAGEGPELQQLQKIATKQVLLLGRTSFGNLKLLYNTADAFIQPNLAVPGDAEGFGLVLLEAASCGLPVFAAHLEGISDAIHAGKNGTLLPSADAQTWIQALTAFARAPQKNLSARTYTLQNFTWDRLKTRYQTAFTALYK